MKIGQYLAKIWTRVQCAVFSGPPCIPFQENADVQWLICKYISVGRLTPSPVPPFLHYLPLPSPYPPFSPLLPLPLEVGPSKQARKSGECCKLPCSRVWAESQLKSNLVHFILKMCHLMATVLMIFLRVKSVNLPKFGQFKQ